MPEAAISRRNLLRHSGVTLGAAGIPEGYREAARIWRALESDDDVRWLLESNLTPDPDLAPAFARAIRRRAQGEPLAYVIGRTGFRHLELRIDRRALIPRPETEGLVDHLLSRVRTGRVVDIGTGSGCLALSLAGEGAFDRVVAIEASREALGLARENRRVTGLSIDLVAGDLAAPLRGVSFDALISNPPYISALEYEGLDPSVRDWEPAVALIGGGDGLGPTRRLLCDARELIRPGGWIALEIDSSRAVASARLAELAGWSEVAVHHDLFDRARYLLARRSQQA